MPVELPQWLEDLRRSGIVEHVRSDPRSTGDTLLGVDFEVARREVVGGGQADFDRPWNGLSPDDRVLLYAYINQPGHLKELVEAFHMLLADASLPEDPVAIDLGCGPFTGGLALAATLDRRYRLDYIGVDRSRAMRELGEKLASAAAEFDRTPRIDRHWWPDVSSVTWGSAPGWRPVVVIVSYLLASPTLDARGLIRELEGLLAKLGRGPVTVLYTNSPWPEPKPQLSDFPYRAAGCGLQAVRRRHRLDRGRETGRIHAPGAPIRPVSSRGSEYPSARRGMKCGFPPGMRFKA